jgi:hypothetical protein
MNFILNGYSDVYSTALMQKGNYSNHAADAKDRGHGKRSFILGLLSRQ